jgi:hypothetical protein
MDEDSGDVGERNVFCTYQVKMENNEKKPGEIEKKDPEYGLLYE